MCANVTPTTSLSAQTSSSRSLLARLTSPLRSRTRNLTEFQIRPDEPHRKYSPGDTIKGAVVLTVVKPIGITHLTVCLHGFVRVFKSPSLVNEPFVDPGLTASNNPRKSQYFGNGHASLFQDEVTLCGKGRLDVGVYEFNFELEFPSKGLPTSLDFERGTISYLITSTLTRPTSIQATSSCDAKVSLVETIDIGPMLPPKPRTISLEPISRKSRRKRTIKTKDGSKESSKDGSKEGSKEGSKDGSKDGGSQVAADTVTGNEQARMTSPLPDDSASQCDPSEHQQVPKSPVPSEIQSTVSAEHNSNDSTVSSSTGMSFRVTAGPSSAKAAHDTHGSKASISDQTITATIELLKSGCLPGDNLPLKIRIKHTKAIRSMHGIIITLFRQGRIDSAPPLSLFADTKGKEAGRLKHEEYYPKSKTGLGGLSLSSAGSSSMFRKDLAQTFAPILVDPMSLTAVVHASVRVPEDVFPTISGVPGQMITFKYHVEVVVDLGGKLAGQQRHVPRIGAVSLPSSYVTTGPRGDGNNPNMIAAWGGSIVGTENIRREKSVVACSFEVVVGTKDTTRNRTRGNSSATRQIDEWTEETAMAPVLKGPANGPIYEGTVSHNHGEQHQHDPNNPNPYYEHEEQYHEYYPEHGYDYEEYYPDQYPPPNHASLPPPPDIQAEEGLSEKERVRRHEERLLPSQPPEMTAGPSLSNAAGSSFSPSAPPTQQEEDIYGADDITPQATNTSEVRHLDIPHAPSAPSFEESSPSAGSSSAEDKQERERRRMMADASNPYEPDDNSGEGPSNRQEPSAPIISDEEGYGGLYSHHDLPGTSSHRDALPKYER